MQAPKRAADQPSFIIGQPRAAWRPSWTRSFDPMLPHAQGLKARGGAAAAAELPRFRFDEPEQRRRQAAAELIYAYACAYESVCLVSAVRTRICIRGKKSALIRYARCVKTVDCRGPGRMPRPPGHPDQVWYVLVTVLARVTYTRTERGPVCGGSGGARNVTTAY